jgi:hypothetical protein
MFLLFWAGSFLTVGLGPWLPHSPLDFLFLGFVKDIVYHENVKNVKEMCDRIIRAADGITNEVLAILGKKLNIILKHVMALMVSIL